MGNRLTTIAVRILLLALLLGGVGVLAAFRDTAVGDTFATNGINLKIDSKGWYNGEVVPSATWYLKNLVPGVDHFFQFDDIKPGDFGCNVISMHVKNQDAYLCLDFKNFESAENGVNEPESEVEPGGVGELGDGTEFFGWRDDGDGKYEPWKEQELFGGEGGAPASSVLNEMTYPIGDSNQGGSCKVNTTRYVGMCWCAGNLTINHQTGKMECDASTIGNEAQTDSWTVDVSIRAEAVKNKKSFTCDGNPPPGNECKAYGFDYSVGKFEWNGSSWVLESSLSSYTLLATGDAQSVDWTAWPKVAGVVGKTGGQGTQTAVFPGGTSQTIDAWKPVGNTGNYHDISHITLCGKYKHGHGY